MAPYPLETIVAWLGATLDPTRCDDYGPNGLQVEATAEVTRVATGVTANLAFIEAAAAWGADLAVVHHGLYWNGSPFTITGTLGRRIRLLLQKGISLAAYHLPLDGHPALGNAPNLGRALGLTALEPAFVSRGIATGTVGRFETPVSPDAFEALLRTHVSATALLFRGGPPTIETVGIVTGGAPRQAYEASARGLDAFVTGEASEYSQALALEERLHVAAAGHHRTETFGPRALVSALGEAFPGLETRFIDVDNPA